MPPAPAATKPTPAPKAAAKPPTVAKPAKPAPKKAEAPPVPPQRPVIYPDVRAEICIGDNAITAEQAKDILGWTTEEERLLQIAAEHPGIGKDALKAYEYGDVYMLNDASKLTDKGTPAGAKVRCYQNLDNRPFDLPWCLGLAQTILNGQWAGPLTIPGETINGSTIVLSRTGKVESGQHSLVALILAHQMWFANRKKYPFWENSVGGPVIETIVIYGISEDRRVLMTVDNCKPRSEADVFYTSDLFVKLTPPDRKECSRMLAAAVDLLWARTDTRGYKTHSEVVGFVDRHMKLLKTLEHIFVENSSRSGRKISALRLSAGQCAALCYLMAASNSDGDAYRNGLPPSEKGLDFKLLDKAKQFWALLAGGEEFKEVRLALGRLVESASDDPANQGLGGRSNEKLAIISKAWDVFRQGFPVVEADVKLVYNGVDDAGNALPDGQLKLLDYADFGGIDVPEKIKLPGLEPKPPTEEEIAAAKEEERRKRAEDVTEKIKALRGGQDSKPAQPKPLTGPTVAAKTAAK